MNIEFILENVIGNVLRITDVTQETDQYIPEDLVEGKYSKARYFNYRYSETCTINIVYYHSAEKDELFKTIYTPHCSKLDEIEVKLPKDGYYEVVHIILPTVEWLQNKLTDEKFDLSTYSSIYVTDGQRVYKYYDNTLTECNIKEIVLINSENTTISRCFKDFFCIWFLQNCYVNLSKKVLSNTTSKCKNSNLSDAIFDRDFVWMTLNVIKYYIEFNQLSEAQNILEEVNSCNGFCNSPNKITNTKSGCGCHG